MLFSFFQGFRYPFRGLRLLLHPRWRALVWLPILINTALFAGGLWWVWRKLYAQIPEHLMRLPDWLAWLSWLIVPVLTLATILLLFYGFTLIANIFGSFFNGFLAERVENWEAPPTQKFERSWWRDIIDALIGELRKLGYFITRALPLLFLLITPILNIIFPLLWGAFGAWMLALQYLDYPLSNHGLSFPMQRRIARQRFCLTFGFGCGVLLMTIVPILNFLSMPSAVIGASLLSVDAKLPQLAIHE
ncbi:MAG: sulfate transporter CysZ [Burkholderiales bacterium]|jgi:CysZ protein|nr:sulfate transporter CysZ [Burkholderiales bacterium]